MKDQENVDERTVKMEVNLDDIPGEWLGHVMELLFHAGARDVFYVPVYMKKNRPGVMMQLLCDQDHVVDMKNILFRETTTLGIRYFPLTVHRLERKFKKVKTKWGEISVKEGIHEGEVLQESPEYEECKQIAIRFNVSVQEVYREVWKNSGE